MLAKEIRELVCRKRQGDLSYSKTSHRLKLSKSTAYDDQKRLRKTKKAKSPKISRFEQLKLRRSIAAPKQNKVETPTSKIKKEANL